MQGISHGGLYSEWQERGRQAGILSGNASLVARRRLEEEALLPLRVRADRLMMVVTWSLWFASLGFALLHQEWLAAFAVGLPVAAAGTVVLLSLPGTLTARVTMAVLLMVMSGLLIHEAHGVIETHFSIFALLAFLLYYRDWRTVAAGAAAIAVEHLTACHLQMMGWPIFVFPMAHNCDMVWVHAAYVLVESVVLIYLSMMGRREAVETLALARFAETALRTGVIDLRRADDGMLRSPVLDSLLETLNHAISRTDTVAGQLQGVSSDVHAAASRILDAGRAQQSSSSSVIDAVRRMAETARTVTERCSAVGEMTREAAQTVSVGHQTMRSTGRTIADVVETVARVAEQMQGLRLDSSRIDEMIAIMADLARQTELLALNATIEAASAGDFGRGFNVIAQEIRLLSTRTHGSLAQAKQRVDRVRAQTEIVCNLAERCRVDANAGSAQVQQAGTRLEEIFNQLPLILGSVSEASAQAVRCGEVSEEAFNEVYLIDAIITANSHDLGQLAQWSASLQDMSGDLAESVSTFLTQPQAVLARAVMSSRR